MFFLKRKKLIPIFSQQAAFLCQTSAALVEMMKYESEEDWKRAEREIKACEVQGDALLTEFLGQLTDGWMVRTSKADLQSLAIEMDDCLDVVKDVAKAILIYLPHKIDPQLRELSQLVKYQADALREMMNYLADIPKHYSAISLQCERVTELEHAADDAYEDYVGYIFQHEEDVRELIKYKNIAEVLETSTDNAKVVSDTGRRILLRYNE